MTNDLSLVPTKDLLDALSDRCDAMAVIMAQDRTQDDGDMFWYANGEHLRVLGLLSELQHFLLTEGPGGPTEPD